MNNEYTSDITIYKVNSNPSYFYKMYTVNQVQLTTIINKTNIGITKRRTT